MATILKRRPPKTPEDKVEEFEKAQRERMKKRDDYLANPYFAYEFIYVPDASPTAKWVYNHKFELYAKGINPALINGFLASPESGFMDTAKGFYRKGKYALRYVGYDKIKKEEAFDPSSPKLEDYLPGITEFVKKF